MEKDLTKETIIKLKELVFAIINVAKEHPQNSNKQISVLQLRLNIINIVNPLIDSLVDELGEEAIEVVKNDFDPMRNLGFSKKSG